MKLRILPSAVEDLHRGREFYARQGDTLGDYFLDSLFSDIDSLELYARVHAKIFGCHRLLAKRFPFAIYWRRVRRMAGAGLSAESVQNHRCPDAAGGRRSTYAPFFQVIRSLASMIP
jgi:hypothetical protein